MLLGKQVRPGGQAGAASQAVGTAGQAGGTVGQAGGTASQAGGTAGQAGGTASQADTASQAGGHCQLDGQAGETSYHNDTVNVKK